MIVERQIRYPRPSLELEYDREALTRDGCCRWVSVVLRLCGIPAQVHLTVTFERAQKWQRADIPYTDEYPVLPSVSNFWVAKEEFHGYEEYTGLLLARAHSRETGTMTIVMSSDSGPLLEAVIRFDSRLKEPQLDMRKSRFTALRFVPFIRSPEDRDALAGCYPSSAGSHAQGNDPVPIRVEVQLPLF